MPDYLVTGRVMSRLHHPSLKTLKIIGGVSVPHIIFSIREEFEPEPLLNEIPVNESTLDVLHLQFSDVDKAGFYSNFTSPMADEVYLNPITPEDADRIVEFYDKYRGNFILSHCMAGISRSSAVVYGLSAVYNFLLRPDFFKHHSPNTRVVKEIVKAAERRGICERRADKYQSLFGKKFCEE